MTKEEANKLIAEYVAESEVLINKAIALADEYDLEFYGPITVSEGTLQYVSKGAYAEDNGLEGDDDLDEDYHECYYGWQGWQSSSHYC